MPIKNKKPHKTTGKRLFHAVLFGEPSGIRTPDTLIKSQITASFYMLRSLDSVYFIGFLNSAGQINMNCGSQKVVKKNFSFFQRNILLFFQTLPCHLLVLNECIFLRSFEQKNALKDIVRSEDQHLHDIGL